METYKAGLKVEPNNPALKEALSEIEGQADAGLSMFSQLFNDPNIWTMLQSDPELKGYLAQPDFLQMITDIQKNPKSISTHLQDKRLMAVISKILLRGRGAPPASTPESAPAPEQPKETKPEPKEEKVEEVPIEEFKPTEEDPEEADKRKANEEKEKGNDAYKKKDFAKAVEHYQNAINLYPKEIAFHTNKAAAYFESGDFNKCIEECETGIDVGRSNGASFEAIAKAYARIGAAYKKLGDLGKAIDAYKRSLTENRVRAVQLTLRQLEKEKEEADKLAYLNPELAQQEKEKGNNHFNKGEFPQAIAAYTEALKRDPQSAPIYSNRAAAYMKLAEFGLALKDCEKCLELDPTYIRAYKRKANIHNFCKDYHKAIDTLNAGLKYAPEDKELKDDILEAKRLISVANADPELRELRRKRAMDDPDIQKIFKNPLIERLLQNFSQGGNQQEALKMLQDPVLAADFERLINAGAIAYGN